MGVWRKAHGKRIAEAGGKKKRKNLPGGEAGEGERREDEIEREKMQDVSSPEVKKEFYLSVLRGLLNYHRRATMCAVPEECDGKRDGICPAQLTIDSYDNALEAAIKAMEAYEMK